ncbi:MAG TPA: hypothetical protein VEP30_00100 [Chthoniobacterales bacterium]|nr:hypothetical protein [Chthoniobacterales bacterium]
MSRIDTRVLYAAAFAFFLLQIASCKDRADTTSTRPSTVPSTAFLLKGRELSSVWINVSTVESNAFAATVYFENGDVFFSDRFIAPPNMTEPISLPWLKEHIIAVDGHSIFVSNKKGQELIFRGSNHPYPSPSK